MQSSNSKITTPQILEKVCMSCKTDYETAVPYSTRCNTCYKAAIKPCSRCSQKFFTGGF